MTVDLTPSNTDAAMVRCNGANCPRVLYIGGAISIDGVRKSAKRAGWTFETTRSTKDYCDTCTKERKTA